jgi:AAA+ ATPase superfamily predicted ATPase
MKLQTGKIVMGSDFTGREKLLREINTYLDMGQSVVLIAPRRYGKSSIIQKIIDTRTGSQSIQIDLMKIFNKRDLAEAIIEETYKLVGISNFFEYTKKVTLETFNAISRILKKFEISIEEIGLNLTVELASENDDDALLRHALGLPEKIAEKLGINILFAIDELGEIRNLKGHEKILMLMRSVFQETKRVNFIFAGSQYSLMNHIFTDQNSPFFRFAEVIHVPTMSAEEFKPFFEDIFRKMEISLYPGFAEDIVRISGGIPYYIVKIAQQVLIDTKLKGKMNVFPFAVCRAAYERYRQEEGYFIGELNRVKGKKYHIQLLKILATGNDPYSELEALGVKKQNINKILIALMNDGLILKTEGEYRIIDPFMRRYLAKDLY